MNPIQIIFTEYQDGMRNISLSMNVINIQKLNIVTAWIMCINHFLLFYITIYIHGAGLPVAARSKASVCGRSPAEIVGSNPAGSMFCVSVVSVVCCQVGVSGQADHSSRGVLPAVVCRCV